MLYVCCVLKDRCRLLQHVPIFFTHWKNNVELRRNLCLNVCLFEMMAARRLLTDLRVEQKNVQQFNHHLSKDSIL